MAEQVTDHVFKAVKPFGADCTHCPRPRAEHANRPDAFEEADEMDAACTIDDCTNTDVESTYCGSYCGEHLKEHIEDCEICRNDFA